jgi:hypothetical protein
MYNSSIGLIFSEFIYILFNILDSYKKILYLAKRNFFEDFS